MPGEGFFSISLKNGENLMKKTAVLLDLGFVLHRLYRLLDKRMAIADEVHDFARRCIRPDDEELFRIYCYHCHPYDGRQVHPVTKVAVEFSTSPTFAAGSKLIRELSLKDNVAFRAGELSFDGWTISNYTAQKIAKTGRALLATDFKPDLKQKRVDMKIGLDVAWLASKGIVERIVLVTGDSDFVPALKFARREGVQVVRRRSSTTCSCTQMNCGPSRIRRSRCGLDFGSACLHLITVTPASNRRLPRGVERTSGPPVPPSPPMIPMIRFKTLRLALAAVMLAVPAAAQQVLRLPAQDHALGGRISTVFAVGKVEGQSWEMLNNAEQAAFDRADNLYVLDRGNQRVLVFDRAGRFVRQLGHKGGGPGEFEVPTGLAVLADGSLAVLDLAHQNLTLFGADGRFRRTVAWQPAWGFPDRTLAADPRGGLVTMLRPGMMPGPGGRLPAIQSRALARVSLTGDGSTAPFFTLPSLAPVQQRVDNSGGATRVNMRMTGPPEFSPVTRWGMLPGGGVAITHTQLYTVKVLDGSGRVVRLLQRPVPVRRPTERDRERSRNQVRERMQSGRGMIVITRGGGGGGQAGPPPMSSEQIEQRVRELEFADTVRTIQGMTVTPSGKLWVERTPAIIGEPGPIDILTPDGRYLGTLNGTKLPIAISATGRAVYLERDDEDVERVVVRQLPAGWY